MMPPVPIEMSAPEFAIPADTLARLVAGVRSEMVRPPLTEDELARIREAEGADLQDDA